MIAALIGSNVGLLVAFLVIGAAAGYIIWQVGRD